MLSGTWWLWLPVASRAEAWIETPAAEVKAEGDAVASSAEAWIETCS